MALVTHYDDCGDIDLLFFLKQVPELVVQLEQRTQLLGRNFLQLVVAVGYFVKISHWMLN